MIGVDGFTAYSERVTLIPHSDESSPLTVLPPREALRRAQALPSNEEMKIEGLTAEEWTAFEQALTER